MRTRRGNHYVPSGSRSLSSYPNEPMPGFKNFHLVIDTLRFLRSNLSAVIFGGLLMACSGQDDAASNHAMTRENKMDGHRLAITADEANARFATGENGLEGYTRLSGAELQTLLVGHEIRNRGPIPYSRQEIFRPDGTSITFLEYRRRHRRYVFAGDALCQETERGWRCRRFYRNQLGLLFQVLDGSNNQPLPIEIR